MKDVMVDIETLGNNSNSVLVQLAACYFDRATGEVGDKFQCAIDIEDSFQYGEVDGSTLKFWFGQKQETIAKVMLGDQKLKNVIKGFKAFSDKADCIWSHATFDWVILNNKLRDLFDTNLNYRGARDLRTLFDLADVDVKAIPFHGAQHDSMDDCLHQVKCAVVAFNKLKGK